MTETEKEFNGSASIINEMLKKARNVQCEDEKECIHWTICRDLHETYKAKMPITETVLQWSERNTRMLF